MNLTLHVWRQKSPGDEGRMVQYQVKDVNEHASFLEMLDVLNEQLAERTARSRSPSSTTAARGSAAPAAS